MLPLHGGLHGEVAPPPLTPHQVLVSWQLPPAVTAGLLVAAALYLWGVWRVRRDHPARPWPVRSTAAWVAGLLTVYVAVGSFVGTYDDTLFSVHMVQHLLLIMVAPPLLVWGRPITLALHASRNPLHTWLKRLTRSRAVALVTNPLVTLGLYTAVVVGTHLTSFMNTVLTNDTAHEAEHALYLVTGYLFFLPLLGSEPLRWRLSALIRALVLVVAMPVDTFTGVSLLTYSREPFPAYGDIARSWGPSLVQDLHDGAAVMWIAGDGLMMLLIVFVLVRWALTDRAGVQLGGYLESARLAVLNEKAGDAPPTPRTDADSDEMLDAYNRYLARLNGSGD
jgi:putative copper resistance protein D